MVTRRQSRLAAPGCRAGGPAALACAAAALLPGAAQSADAPTYACDFRHSMNECGFAEQSRSPGHAAQVIEAGVPAVRLRTEPGDSEVAGSGAAERADLTLSPSATGCRQGAEQWWAHSVLFPNGYAPPVARSDIAWPWGVVFDFHQTGPQGQPNFQIDVTGTPPEIGLSISGGPVVSDGTPGSPTRHWHIGPITLNHWYRFVYHVRWSANADGWFAAWLDDRPVLDYHGPTLYTGQDCYLKLANYHTPVGRSVSILHARVIRGATRASLEAPDPAVR